MVFILNLYNSTNEIKTDSKQFKKVMVDHKFIFKRYNDTSYFINLQKKNQ